MDRKNTAKIGWKIGQGDQDFTARDQVFSFYDSAFLKDGISTSYGETAKHSLPDPAEYGNLVMSEEKCHTNMKYT